MNRYIIIQEGHPPFSTDYYDPENHEPEVREDGFIPVQTVINVWSGEYRVNQGENAGKWLPIKEDHL